MGKIREIDGDLIKLALNKEFEVIAHGCNCFCVMGAGIAPQMAHSFGADRFPMESKMSRGDIRKLGCIDYRYNELKDVTIVNCYTQFAPGKNPLKPNEIPLDYEALTLCMRKMNWHFKGSTIGLPKIGCGLAGGDWEIVKKIIEEELCDCDVTIVNYKSQD